MKKVFSWIFAIVQLLLIITFILCLVLYFVHAVPEFENIFVAIMGISIVPIILIGIWGHVIAEEKSFPYYVTFPVFGIACGVMFIVGGIKTLFLKLLGADTYEKQRENTEKVYFVRDNGYERKLILVETYCKDYGAPKGYEFGAYYNRFKDDLGYFWRSYDGNKTFVSESYLRKNGWNIS